MCRGRGLVAATGCWECEAAHAEIGYHGKYFCALFDHSPPPPPNPWKKTEKEKILARTKLLGRVWLEEVVGVRKETGA